MRFEWSAATRRWWRGIWSSPMAAEWLLEDLPGLIRLAQLQEMTFRGLLKESSWPEQRRLEGEFGLSPLARRRLGWEVPAGPPPPPEPDPADAQLERELMALMDERS